MYIPLISATLPLANPDVEHIQISPLVAPEVVCFLIKELSPFTVPGAVAEALKDIENSDSLVIQVGNGMRDASDSVNYIDPIYPEEEDAIDEFEASPIR